MNQDLSLSNKWFLGLFILTFIGGCVTPVNQSISSIKPSQLQQQGMIVGHMSLYDSKTKSELGGLFGPNFQAYATRLGDNKKVYEVWVENKDQGYFGWLVEPGTYWVHYCRISDMNGETSLGDMKPYIEVKAGEIAYIGHIHYEIGKTHFGKTMKKIFSSGVKENLLNMGGVLVDVERKIMNNLDDMKAYLQKAGLNGKPITEQIVEGWKYASE